MAYRKKHGIPLDLPLYLKGKGGVKTPRVMGGKPADCLITPGTGRPEKCSTCPVTKLNKCLDFAVKNRWERGWKFYDGRTN